MTQRAAGRSSGQSPVSGTGLTRRGCAWPWLFAALIAVSGCDEEPAPCGQATPPQVVLDDDPEIVALYDRAWQLANRNVRRAPEGSPLNACWLDEAFNDNIYQWDTAFMVMFARYAADQLPVGESLSNFYRMQHDNGYIVRELRESDGHEVWPYNDPMAINPPLFAWSEWALYEVTADESRLVEVLPHLVAYHDWLAANRRWDDGLYWSTGYGSGMDNSPRNGEREPIIHRHFGYRWIDMSAQQALNATYTARIAREVGEAVAAERLDRAAADLDVLINERLWDEADGMYYDARPDGSLTGVRTIASFWPMVAGVVPVDRCDRLVQTLLSPDHFWRANVFPTLAASEPLYDPSGGYWRGGVWAPTNYATIRGLSRCGHEDVAYEAAGRHVRAIAKVAMTTGTIWENWAPEFPEAGSPSLPHFVGWSGASAIALIIEDLLGLRVDAASDSLLWLLRRKDLHGIDGLRFGDNRLSVRAAPRPSADSAVAVRVMTDSTVTIRFVIGAHQIERTFPPGAHEIMVHPFSGS